MNNEPETFTIRGHELVAVDGSWRGTAPIRALAVDMGLPKVSCAFCPGYVRGARPPSVRCSWGSLCLSLHAGKAYRFVTPEVWATIKLRS